ncbi:VanZ family protein [Litchfieldia salsa]|uniref:VanZ-like domain-containing protein n=1 Tax=Litchfieldia salsa TaxID=930152 RepID=A0A1H0W3Y7_9BACI|nr:VanZ family protein [Litchfieldia salsa]SDP85278.1 hypothetical protein SAMN05216565_10925 [Litchfieldia salsa]
MIDILEYVLNVGEDKQLHFLFYFGLSFLLGVIVLFISSKDMSITCLRLLWISLVILGVIEEFRQYTLPDRNAEFLDGVANFCGVTCGLFLPFFFAYLRVMIYKRKLVLPLNHILELSAVIPFYLVLWVINERPW